VPPLRHDYDSPVLGEFFLDDIETLRPLPESGTLEAPIFLVIVQSWEKYRRNYEHGIIDQHAGLLVQQIVAPTEVQEAVVRR
jgi:hypothetical protein